MDQGALIIVLFAAIVLAGVTWHFWQRRKNGPPPEA
jgi:hypothetical protein